MNFKKTAEGQHGCTVKAMNIESERHKDPWTGRVMAAKL